MSDKKIDLSHFDNIMNQGGPVEDYSQLGSAGLGALQGASFGFADEAEAGLRSAVQDSTYDELINSIRNRYKGAEEANPMSYLAGDLAGSFAVPAGTLGAASKGASIGKKLLDAGKVGAVAGGLTSLGTTEEDKLSGAALKDAGAGAVTGAGAAMALGVGLPAAVKGADKFASEFDYYKYLKHAYQQAKAGKSLRGNAIDEAGEAILNPISKEPVSVLESKVTEVKDLGNKLMGDVSSDVSEKGAALGKLRELPQPIDVSDPVNAVRQSLDAMYAPGEAKSEVNKVKNILDDLLKLSTPEAKGAGEAEQFMAQQYGQPMSQMPKSIPVDQKEVDVTINELKKIAYDKNSTPAGKKAANEAIDTLSGTLDAGRNDNLLAKIDKAKEAYATGVDVKAQLSIPERMGTSQSDRSAQYAAADRLSNMIENYSSKGSDARETLIDALNKLKNSNSQELKEMLDLSKSTNVNELIAKIDQASKDLKVSKMMAATSSIDKAKGGIVGSALGTLQASGKAVPLITADVAGKVAALPSKAVSKLISATDDIYKASPEMLQAIADKMGKMGSPFAKQMLSVASAPERRRKALLFTLMQQPAFRTELEKGDGTEIPQEQGH